jgi:predicted flap endonuclease-1-like 5' DNA nuclease
MAEPIVDNIRKGDMDKYENHFTNTVLVWSFGLILGVLFGLVVLGWWLWPVQWVDASPEQLLYQYQVEYLNTTIEAYGFTGNTSVAQARYFALGTNAETALAEIVQNPGSLPPELVAAFSQQVVGVPVDTLASKPVETPKTTTGMNTWIAILIALFFLFIGGVATYLVVRGKRRQEEEVGAIPYEAATEEEAEAEDLEAEPILSQADFEEPFAEETGLPEETRATVSEEWYPLSSEAELEEAPVDLEVAPAEQEAAPEEFIAAPAGDTELDLPPFLAAAAAGAAAGYVASELTEEEPVEEIAFEEETVSELPEIEFLEEPAEPLDDSRVEGAAMAGLATAWLAEDEGAEQEEPVVAEQEEPVFEEEIEAPDFGDLEVEESVEETEFPDLEPEEGITGETVAAVQEEAAEVEAEIEVEELVKPHDPIEVKMRKKLEYVEGIGPAYAAKLGEIGILTTGKLMVEGVTRSGRQELAEKSGITETLILKWLNMIDLYRIKGIGSEYAELLEAAGVDTVPELAQRNADNLYQALANKNEEKRLVRQLPTPEQVVEWVEQAKNLPRIIQY